MSTLPDLWSGCYDGQARKAMSPEDFRKQFCDNCMNAGCRNSKGSGMTWVQRMATQADRLLHNPNFANTDDPQFRELAQMDFQDRLREALAIEVADRKGDWSVPTNEEIGAEAASLVGLVPSGFEASSEEAPKPPERLVDEVKVSDAPDRATLPLLDTDGNPVGPVLTEGPIPHLGTSRVVADRMRGQNDVLVQIDDPQEPVGPDPEPLGRWRVRGGSGNLWEVTQVAEDRWSCTCPSQENPCKHARDIQHRMMRSAPAPAPTPQAPPRMPQPAPRGPAGVVRGNTKVPDGGVMLGGPAPAPASDPWAPTHKPAERKVPVGGRVRFGKKKS